MFDSLIFGAGYFYLTDTHTLLKFKVCELEEKGLVWGWGGALIMCLDPQKHS